jgi:DNA (cytosine-5)-methyltransferase 1
MNELALFAGAGGGILAGNLLGWTTVCAVERDAYAAQILAQRQNDGIIGAFPIWSDVCSFDGRPWRGLVDVVSGGFPCQDISGAGKGAGIEGGRSGLWSQFARIIGEVRPRLVYVENSPLLTGRGIYRVLGDLAEMGFDAEWGIVSAENTGAPHQRKRIWILANSDSNNKFRRRSDVQVGGVWESRKAKGDGDDERIKWPAEPGMGRVADGVAYRVDRVKALGNGQVPRVAATAFSLLKG